MAGPGNGSSRNPEDSKTDISTPVAASTSRGRGSAARGSTARKKRRLDDVEENEKLSDDENAPILKRGEETPRKKKRVNRNKPKADAKVKAKGDNGNDSGGDDDDDDEDMPDELHESDMEDQEETTMEGTEGEHIPAAAAAPVVNNAENANSKMPATATTKARPPMPILKVPAHQTPGKFKDDKYARSTTNNRPSTEVTMPTRQLVFGNTPTAASNDAAVSSLSQGQTPRLNEGTAVFNGTSNVERAPMVRPAQVPPRARNDPLASTMVWLGLLFILTLSYGLIQSSMFPNSMPPLGVVKAADVCLDQYKRIYYQYYPPPTRQVTNQTRVHEIKQMERERLENQQQKRKLLKDLEGVQTAMKREITAMEKNAVEMQKDFEGIEERVKNHSGPVLQRHDRISQIKQILENKTSDDLNETVKALPDIKDALGETDREKVLDISSLDLWEIPEMPENCLGGAEGEESDESDDEEDEEEGEEDEEDEEDDENLAIAEGDDGPVEVAVPIIDKERLQKWSDSLQELIDNSTDDILKDDEVADQIRQWIRSAIKDELDWDKVLANFTIEKLAKQIVKKEQDGGKSKGGGSLRAEAILSQIAERLELEIADQTGRFDFASIRNGAAVIRGGPRATSKSLVQSLPYVNRVMAHFGLRFYGHGAEAALIPTDPPDALGQCWAFMGEDAIKKRRKSKAVQDFSRGSVATLTVRLARPIFVHSVVIEHPPREITDRMDSAIRTFRVVGYEDSIGSKGSHELGRFEYKPDEGPRVEFEVARKLSRREIPKLQSIALAIESTWGRSDDYGCLYRFRVHGDDNE